MIESAQSGRIEALLQAVTVADDQRSDGHFLEGSACLQAIAAPMPLDAPVTTATCPCSFFDMTGLLCFLTGTTIASGQLERDSSAHWLTSLARPPGFAECPERNLEQGQVLDENLPQDRRQGREAETCPGPDGRAETILSGSLLTASSGLPGAPPRGPATVGERTGAFASGMPTPES